VSALFWPLYSRTAWAQPATVVAVTMCESLFWPLFARLVWAQPTTMLAGTKGEGAAVVCVRSVGVSSASLCVGEHER
jgi:hypothetical protein